MYATKFLHFLAGLQELAILMLQETNPTEAHNSIANTAYSSHWKNQIIQGIEWQEIGALGNIQNSYELLRIPMIFIDLSMKLLLPKIS